MVRCSSSIAVCSSPKSQPGVDLILPDFTPIAERWPMSRHILTHGHEDHIGAVPYLLRMRPDIPIYGSRLTLAFLKAKTTEHRLSAGPARSQ